MPRVGCRMAILAVSVRGNRLVVPALAGRGGRPGITDCIFSSG